MNNELNKYYSKSGKNYLLRDLIYLSDKREALKLYLEKILKIKEVSK